MATKRPVPRLREFVSLVGREIDRYNAERPHRSLGGDAPLDVRRANPIEVAWLEPRHVALALMRRARDPKIGKAGIEFLGVLYFAPELIAHIGETVEIGWLEQRPDYIEVFDPNHCSGEPEWLCRATPASEATKAFANRVDEARRHDVEWLGSVELGARRIRDERYAAFLAERAGDVDDAPGADVAPPGCRRRKPSEVEQHEQAKRDLDALKAKGVFRG